MTVKPFDVVVVGAVGIDTNVYLHGREVDFSVEMNFSQNLDTVGQAGGYSARILSALGFNTSFIGFVGDDMCGHEVRQVLSSEGIDVSGLGVDPQGTKRSVNIMYPDGRRRNFYDGRGSMDTPIDLGTYVPVFKGSPLAHFSIVDWARHLLPTAKDCGCLISCDLQDLLSLDDDYRHDFLEAADILFFSAVNHDSPEPMVRELLRRKPESTIVCGCGSQGCLVGTNEGIVHFSAIEEGPPVIDTNGAGDSLACGFVAGRVLHGLSVSESISWGQTLARHCCTLKGTKDGCFLSLDELTTKLHK